MNSSVAQYVAAIMIVGFVSLVSVLLLGYAAVCLSMAARELIQEWRDKWD